MILTGMYTKSLFGKVFENSVRCEKYLIEQAIKSLLPTQNGRFHVIFLSFRLALSIPLIGR